MGALAGHVHVPPAVGSSELDAVVWRQLGPFDGIRPSVEQLGGLVQRVADDVPPFPHRLHHEPPQLVQVGDGTSRPPFDIISWSCSKVIEGRPVPPRSRASSAGRLR